MNKNDVATLIHEADATVQKTTIVRVLDALASVAKKRLGAGEEMIVPGVVKVQVQDTAARQGRNPATGATIQIPAGRKVKVKAVGGLI